VVGTCVSLHEADKRNLTLILLGKRMMREVKVVILVFGRCLAGARVVSRSLPVLISAHPSSFVVAVSTARAPSSSDYQQMHPLGTM
jgi:hypothetical protein